MTFASGSALRVRLALLMSATGDVSAWVYTFFDSVLRENTVIAVLALSAIVAGDLASRLSGLAALDKVARIAGKAVDAETR